MDIYDNIDILINNPPICLLPAYIFKFYGAHIKALKFSNKESSLYH